MFRLLAIDIGSTSTRIGFYNESSPLIRGEITYHMSDSRGVSQQLNARRQDIQDFIKDHAIDTNAIDLYVSRGGLGKPGPSGVYLVNDLMCEDLLTGRFGFHISALGPVIVRDLASSCGKKAVVVDPPSTDEFHLLARVSGHPDIERQSAFHALNQKEAARKVSHELGKAYEHVNIIIAHMGGGITIGAHRQGRVIDATHGLYEGPFTPERAGSLPNSKILELCTDKGFSKQKIQKQLIGEGGLFAYLGTKDAQKIEEMIRNGDARAEHIYHAMAYQIAKDIGAMAAVLKGDVNAIVLTGGLACSQMLVSWISEMVGFIGRIFTHPGEDEICSLIKGGLRVIHSQEKILSYPPEDQCLID
jgi:butyrate kinase